MNQFWMSLIGRESLISEENVWGILLFLFVGAFISIWLEQRYSWAVKVSGAIIGLLFGLVCSNLGIIPTSCALYDDIIFDILVPMAMPMLLLQCNIRKIWREAGRMLAIFLLSALGTMVGAFIAYYGLSGPYGNTHDAGIAVVGLTGAYIGGGMNMVSLCQQYNSDGELTAALMVADSLVMALSLLVLVAIAHNKYFVRKFEHCEDVRIDENFTVHSAYLENDSPASDKGTASAKFWNRKQMSLKDIASNVAYSVAVIWLSKLIAAFFENNTDGVLQFVGSQQYLWITTISVIIASTLEPFAASINGSQDIGMYFMYVFFVTIGAPANLYVVITKGPWLFAIAMVMVTVNIIVTLILAKVMNFKLEEALLASNANIGATSTAVGMTTSQGWMSLIAPGLLVAILGYVLGNYCGIFVAAVIGL